MACHKHAMVGYNRRDAWIPYVSPGRVHAQVRQQHLYDLDMPIL